MLRSPTLRPSIRSLALALALPSAIGVDSTARAGADEDRGPAWKRHVIDDSSRGADGVRLADVDGDGRLDIATGWEEGGVVRLARNPGADRVRTRWPTVTVGKVAAPEDAVAVDLDGDGAVDVVSSCEGKTRSVFVHWAPKDHRFLFDPDAWTTEPIPVTQGTAQWMFCAPMQVDGRHGIDLVLGAKGKNARIGWLEAPPEPRDLDRWKWHPLYKAGWIMSLLALDMDADGDADILASDRRGPKRGCLWLENPGPGPKQFDPWPEHGIGADGKEVMFLDPADLDGDGLTDIVVTTFREPELYLLRRRSKDGLRWQTVRLNYPANVGTGKAVKVADVDRDGKLDIVLSCGNAKGGKSGVVWLSNRNDPAAADWAAHEISGPAGVKFDLVQMIDLDDDGDLDCITCEERDNLGVFWYENPTVP